MSIFRPILAGGNLADRTLACIGALLGIIAAALAGGMTEHILPLLPYLVAPMGASAVLVFAVPASPLAQPWPVIGGNVISAAIGIVVAQAIPNPIVAAGTAVASAIFVMSLLRCLHPPGGAAALLAVLGGDTVSSAGFAFAFILVAINAVALVTSGLLFHRFTRHPYPHVAEQSGERAHSPLLRVDIDQALYETGETFDIDPADLESLLLRAEAIADMRLKSKAAK